MATIWNTDGTSEEVQPVNGRDFSLDELRRVVDGWIEVVKLDERTRMVVNEDGRALGLPFNPMGTQLYDDMARRNGHPGGSTGFAVVGRVLVCDVSQID